MTLFKKKKDKKPALYFSLDRELRHARIKKKTSFYYPLNENEVSKGMAWGIKNRVAIESDYITDGITYYKFYGYSLDL